MQGLRVADSKPGDNSGAWADVDTAKWRDIGYSEDGWTLEMDRTFEDILVAEEVDPIKTIKTAQEARLMGELSQASQTNIQTALGGGTITTGDGSNGYASGYNIGLKNIDDDILCLLNNDIEVTENWTEEILNQFIAEPDTAAIQPKLRDYNNKSNFDYAGAAGGFLDKYGYPYCNGRIYNKVCLLYTSPSPRD